MRITEKIENEKLLIQNFSKKAQLVVKRDGNICFSYDRVSSRDQMINGNSLKWQFERIDDFASKNNLIIKKKFGGTYESAKTDERKEFKRMIEEIKKDTSIAAIIIYSYDRFSRSGSNGIFLLENLRNLGVRIISITQEVDSFTPTGNFQENLYMLLSKLDNDMRRDKSVSGTRSILQKGYWPYHTPLGYKNLNKHATADKHHYIITADGELLKKAFLWKASGRFSNQQIIEKLDVLGLKISLRNIAWIFSNTFYCGYISSSMLPGELIKGKHPALIDEKTFLLVNQISKQNSRTGVPKKLSVDSLPLKVFMKDYETGSPFTGYHNKKKDLFYYKSRNKGTNVSIAAKKLNAAFEKIISSIDYNKKYKSALKHILENKLKQHFANNSIDEKLNKKRITEIKNKIEVAEEQLVLNKITKLYGFDLPLHQRFFLMIKKFLIFDFNESFYSDKKNIDLILEKLPVSISLGIWSTLLIYLVSIPLGIKKALNDGNKFDLWSSAIIIFFYSIPAFLLAILLMIIFCGGNFLNIFPLRGLTSSNFAELNFFEKIIDYLWHLVLPIFAMIIGGFASLTFFCKNTFLEEINKNYVITSYSKGLTQNQVQYFHIFRNALLQVIASLFTILIGVFFTSSLLIEIIFSLDGLGLLSYEAIISRDYSLIFASLYIFSIIGLVGNIITDFIYFLIDPRINFK